MNSITRGIRRTKNLLTSTIVVLGLAAAFASTAHAGSDSYSCNLAPADSCVGPNHTLTASAAYDSGGGSRRVCAASKFSPNGSFNGSYFCANYLACHTYGGSSPTYPVIRNGTNATSPSTFNITGLTTWGSTPPPSYCPAGSASRAAPTGTDASPQTFESEHGTGRLFADAANDRVCLAIPDTDGEGITCRTEKELAAGLLNGELVTDSEKESTSTFAAALPTGASATLTRPGGERQTVRAINGVATGTITGPATLHLSGAGVDQTINLNALSGRTKG